MVSLQIVNLHQISISMMVGKYCLFKNAAYKLIATKPYTFDSGTVGLSASFQFLQFLQWALVFLKHDCSLYWLAFSNKHI